MAETEGETKKVPGRDFLKKHKWWIIAGLALLAVGVFYFVNRSNSAAASAQNPAGQQAAQGQAVTAFPTDYGLGVGPAGPAGVQGPRGRRGPRGPRGRSDRDRRVRNHRERNHRDRDHDDHRHHRRHVDRDHPAMRAAAAVQPSIVFQNRIHPPGSRR